MVCVVQTIRLDELEVGASEEILETVTYNVKYFHGVTSYVVV